MRICVINPNYYRSSGVTMAIRRIHEAVSPYGMDAYFVNCRYGSEEEELSWIPPHRMEHLPLMSLNPLAFMRSIMRLRRLLDRWDIQLIHVHHRRLSILLTALEPLLRRPILYSGNLTSPFSLTFWLLSPRHAIAVTNSVRDNLMATTRTRNVEILGNPTPFPDTCPSMDVAKVRRRAVCVARLVPVKGHQTLIDAWALLRDRGVANELVLVGEGPLRESLEARSQALGLADLITFRGFVSDVRSDYEQALFAILASSIEGQGIVTIEAAAAGRASLLTDVDGSRDCLPPNRALPNGLPYGKAEALADALQFWFANPEAVAEEGRTFFDFHQALNSSKVLGEKYAAAYQRTGPRSKH
ncbi:MAG TPA: glycosyltransferase family 4 protein [Variovorax sp.]